MCNPHPSSVLIRLLCHPHVTAFGEDVIVCARMTVMGGLKSLIL